MSNAIIIIIIIDLVSCVFVVQHHQVKMLMINNTHCTWHTGLQYLPQVNYSLSFIPDVQWRSVLYMRWEKPGMLRYLITLQFIGNIQLICFTDKLTDQWILYTLALSEKTTCVWTHYFLYFHMIFVVAFCLCEVWEAILRPSTLWASRVAVLRDSL